MRAACALRIWKCEMRAAHKTRRQRSPRLAHVDAQHAYRATEHTSERARLPLVAGGTVADRPA
jgi:hypothetical protein